MHVLDSSGRQVSILNDDSGAYGEMYSSHRLPVRGLSYNTTPSYQIQRYALSRSHSSSPNTPELLRSDSYDSQASSDARSPVTPNVRYDYRAGDGGKVVSIGDSAGDYLGDGSKYVSSSSSSVRGGGTVNDSQLSGSYDDASQDRNSGGKRYPCRYRGSHGCEKTFTTSGHASRHSKIHTAEKAVHCSFPGCSKKFTRADNMKQHLETHYKDKSRSSTSHSRAAAASGVASSAKSSSSSSSSSGSRRTSNPMRPTTLSSSSEGRHSRDRQSWDTTTTTATTADRYLSSPMASPQANSSTPLQSPGLVGGAWDMRDLKLPLTHHHSARRTTSGLDALAMAIACQERTSS